MIGSEPMQYQMVFCDIDGTLIDSKHRISKDTKQKIQELYHAGIPFVLVSARMPSGIFPLQNELGIEAPIVCYSGALILNERGSPIQTIGMKREKAIQIESYIKTEWDSVFCSAYSDNHWIAEDIANEWIVQEQTITSSVPTQGTVLTMLPHDGSIHKFLCMGQAKAIAGLTDAMKEHFPGLTVYRSKDTYLEIMDAAASKSGAVHFLCREHGVPIEATVSFGDNFNDVDMLLATGTCFAMGNAPEAVKKQVKQITLDNDHEGVLAGLNQLVFAKNRI